MTLETVESLVRWLGGLLANITLAVLLYGIWRGTQRKTGRTGTWLRSGWFTLITSALFFGVCFLGWRSLPLVVSPSTRLLMLVIGTLLYFPGMSLVLWARLKLGRNYFASTEMNGQLFADPQLITSGALAILRHPMYAGIILAGFGSLLLYATWTTLFLACFAPLTNLRVWREEIALTAEFGEQWQEYCKL